MIYQWKFKDLYPVNAQTAGEELDRIYQKHGALTAAEIVNESREETAPLHPCFEWNDAVAAEKYRETQATEIVRAIVAISESNGQQQEIRAFVHVEKNYQPISVVINNEEKMTELLAVALKELQAFQRKYATLSELKSVFAEIEKLTA